MLDKIHKDSTYTAKYGYKSTSRARFKPSSPYSEGQTWCTFQTILPFRSSKNPDWQANQRN